MFKASDHNLKNWIFSWHLKSQLRQTESLLWDEAADSLRDAGLSLVVNHLSFGLVALYSSLCSNQNLRQLILNKNLQNILTRWQMIDDRRSKCFCSFSRTKSRGNTGALFCSVTSTENHSRVCGCKPLTVNNNSVCSSEDIYHDMCVILCQMNGGLLIDCSCHFQLVSLLSEIRSNLRSSLHKIK